MNETPQPHRSLEDERSERLRRFLVAGSLVGVAYLAWTIVTPFLEALGWAIITVLSLWPLHNLVRARLIRSQTLAASLMTFLVFCVLMLPFSGLAYVVSREANEAATFLNDLLHGRRGEDLIESLRKLPQGGPRAAEWLTELRADPRVLHGLAEANRALLLRIGTGVVNGLTTFAFNAFLAVFASYFIFRHGEAIARDLRRGLRRLAGEKMVPMLRQVRETVRGVVYGSVLTSLSQAVAATLGFWICGVPVPLILGLLTLVLSFIPIGPPLVWIPASLYLFGKGEIFWGIASLVWGAGVVSMLDNLLRPIFIGKSAEIPVFLVFLGVMGGLLNFGFIGIFVGPVIVAVALALWREWVASAEAALTIEMPITGAFPTESRATADQAPKSVGP